MPVRVSLIPPERIEGSILLLLTLKEFTALRCQIGTSSAS